MQLEKGENESYLSSFYYNEAPTISILNRMGGKVTKFFLVGGVKGPDEYVKVVVTRFEMRKQTHAQAGIIRYTYGIVNLSHYADFIIPEGKGLTAKEVQNNGTFLLEDIVNAGYAGLHNVRFNIWDRCEPGMLASPYSLDNRNNPYEEASKMNRFVFSNSLDIQGIIKIDTLRRISRDAGRGWVHVPTGPVYFSSN